MTVYEIDEYEIEEIDEEEEEETLPADDDTDETEGQEDVPSDAPSEDVPFTIYYSYGSLPGVVDRIYTKTKALRATSTHDVTIRSSELRKVMDAANFDLGPSLGITNKYRPYYVIGVPYDYTLAGAGENSFFIQNFESGVSANYAVLGYATFGYFPDGALYVVTGVPTDVTTVTLPLRGYDGFQLYYYNSYNNPSFNPVSDSATRTLSASDCAIDVSFDISGDYATYNGKTVDCATCYFTGETPPSPTPTPTPTSTPTPTATPEVTPTPTPSSTPDVIPSPTASAELVESVRSIETEVGRLADLQSVLVFCALITLIMSSMSAWRRSIR